VDDLLQPANVDEVAHALAHASRAKLRVAVHGGGTKDGWGPTPPPADVGISTRRLDAVVAHRYGDLTATVQAGATLAAVNRELARHGQWIPLDPPSPDRATIGGIVATNDAGPRRHRYGTPRDLIIGIDIVRIDGTAAKSGGIVVKNVAGYDLGRLMTGSFGSLAVITSATFKLYPIPPASRTLVIDVAEDARLDAILSTLTASQLTPTAIELETNPLRLLVRFESIEAAAIEQARQAARIAESNGAATTIVAGADETSLWEAHERRAWEGDGAVIKLTLLPSDLSATLAWLASTGEAWEMIGRAGVGALLLSVDGDAAVQARVLKDLRARFAPGRGSAVLVRGSEALKALVDVWGPPGDSLPLMRAVKQQFDPDGLLNPGRGPFGL
jgi:glycolate oxidase FAD binding subunit